MCGGVWSRISRSILALLMVPPVVWGVWVYPLPASPLVIAVLAYAIALWCRPSIFLVIVPALLPALDLGTWTGWTMVGESDFFLLTTIAVLVLRAPPRWIDWYPRPWPHFALLLLTLCTAVSAAIGLATGGNSSSNQFLRPDNALRLFKPFVSVLILLPFMRDRHRVHGDTALLLGWGMIAGAAAVAVETMIERAVFPGLFNFTSDYRVAAAFSSMNVGGGHIGAYLAMTLPFLLGVGLSTWRWYARPIVALVAAGAGFALVVTFARTAYAAGLASLIVATGAFVSFGRRTSSGSGNRGVAVVLSAIMIAGLIAAGSFGFMRERLKSAAFDLFVRETNWRRGLAVRNNDAPGLLFGMGLGTYPRIMLAGASEDRPTDFRLEGPAETPVLTIDATTPSYIGQKISIAGSRQSHLTLRWRATEQNASVGVLICEKLLLYSDNCRGETFQHHHPGVWEDVTADIPPVDFGQAKVAGLLSRPIEFSLFGGVSGTTISITGLSLTDDLGREILANRDFRHGMDRWIFTDDRHTAWRIFSLYLMLLFETGVLGLAAFVTVAGIAIVGAVKALRRGDAMGAAVIGSIASFLVSGLFDNVMEAPRLATVFLLVCATGIILFEPGGKGDSPLWTGLTGPSAAT